MKKKKKKHSKKKHTRRRRSTAKIIFPMNLLLDIEMTIVKQNDKLIKEFEQ